MQDDPDGQARNLDAEIRQGTHGLEQSQSGEAQPSDSAPSGSRENPAAKEKKSKKRVKVPSTPPPLPANAPMTPAVQAAPGTPAAAAAAAAEEDVPMEQVPQQQQMDISALFNESNFFEQWFPCQLGLIAVSEVYSPPRVTDMAWRMNLMPGTAFDFH